MTDTRNCKCSFNLVIQFFNCFILLLVLVIQGSILDYYLILHNGGTAGWYFWFLADLLVLISFMASVVISYRYYKKKVRMREMNASKLQLQLAIKKKLSVPKPLPKTGLLPLGYLVWVFYASLLIVKIILLFKMQIAQKLDENSTFGPQLLKVVIGMSAIVFFLLVEAHNDAEPLSDRQAFMHLLITGTAFEIFDSITFLGILLPNESKVLLPFSLEDAVLGLACANFFLPGLALYKLSQSEFGIRPRSLGLSLLYKALHLLLINIPYLVIRIYLWSTFSRDISLFLMKNIMAVVAHIMTSIPDLRLWFQMIQERKMAKEERFKKASMELTIISGKAEGGEAPEATEKRKMIGTEAFDDINLTDYEKGRENSRL